MVIVASDLIMGLIGGVCIGLSAVLFLLGNGRIAGISGIASSLLNPRTFSGVAVAFLVGLIGAPYIYGHLVAMPEIVITNDMHLLLLAGLLVGFGARFGGGCTSGHGICGVSRFSPRSIVSTLTFMTIGMVVAAFVRPLLGG